MDVFQTLPFQTYVYPAKYSDISFINIKARETFISCKNLVVTHVKIRVQKESLIIPPKIPETLTGHLKKKKKKLPNDFKLVQALRSIILSCLGVYLLIPGKFAVFNVVFED